MLGWNIVLVDILQDSSVIESRFTSSGLFKCVAVMAHSVSKEWQ
jgi:hypothetical protein